MSTSTVSRHRNVPFSETQLHVAVLKEMLINKVNLEIVPLLFEINTKFRFSEKYKTVDIDYLFSRFAEITKWLCYVYHPSNDNIVFYNVVFFCFKTPNFICMAALKMVCQ